ncbi:MAG: hypothetical protein DRP78_01220 [Candidatus Omnitrophota bacterium]|nr:MAG: hypothetical protein DRP78_01220 [Candidatus Omnitrophota bacterium]
MQKNHNIIVEAIITKLKEQTICYQHIYELSRRQKESIASGAVDSLLKILTDKQRELDKSECRQKEILQLKQQWEKIKEFAADEVKKQLRDEAEKVAALLAKIVSLEKENIALALERKQAVGKKIQQCKTGKKAVGSYLFTSMPTGSKLMDKRL